MEIHSYTKDFYFAALVKQSGNEKKQFIGNCMMSFVPGLEAFEFVSDICDLKQTMLDFECKRLVALENAILALVVDKESLIFNKLKVSGGICNLIVLELWVTGDNKAP